MEPLSLPTLPPRDPKGHKGTFGAVAVVGGCATESARMLGAPALAARGAIRAGAGLARIAAPRPLLDHLLLAAPFATGVAIPVDEAGEVLAHEASAIIDALMRESQCLVIGPGLGVGEGPRAASLRAVQQDEVPVIVDADAINNLTQVPELSRDFRAPVVLTPHPGEFRRLAAALRITIEPRDFASREAAAEALAQRLGCIIVLKGAGTVVSDGQRTWTCGHGHPCLATGGTGDVLAGIIAGLVAQYVGIRVHPKLPANPSRPLDLFDAARIGVQAHALAGEAWARMHSAEAGLLPNELADSLPSILSAMVART